VPRRRARGLALVAAAAAGLSIVVVTAIVRLPSACSCVQARGGIPVPSAKAARFVVVSLGRLGLSASVAICPVRHN